MSGIAGVLPHVTTFFNAIALICILTGFACIRAGRRDLHRRAMLAAVTSSGLFLATYLLYHFTAPIFVFRGGGLARSVYYTLLVSHVLLAVAVTPMIGLSLLRALKGDFAAHPRIARLTLPIWIYVSASGIVVYLLLYHIYN